MRTNIVTNKRKSLIFGSDNYLTLTLVEFTFARKNGHRLFSVGLDLWNLSGESVKAVEAEL